MRLLWSEVIAAVGIALICVPINERPGYAFVVGVSFVLARTFERLCQVEP